MALQNLKQKFVAAMAYSPNGTMDALGINFATFHKLRFIPFSWDRKRQRVNPFGGSERLRKAHKIIMFALFGINLAIMTQSVIRSVRSSNASELKKLQEVVTLLKYWSFLSSMVIVFQSSDGIPMLINNLQKISGESDRNFFTFTVLLKLPYCTKLLFTSRWNQEEARTDEAAMVFPLCCGVHLLDARTSNPAETRTVNLLVLILA